MQLTLATIPMFHQGGENLLTPAWYQEIDQVQWPVVFYCSMMYYFLIQNFNTF